MLFVLFALFDRTFYFLKSGEQFSLNAGKYVFHCYGAQGGHGYCDGNFNDGGDGGKGAHVYGTITLNNGPQTFYAFVGGMGASGAAGGNQGGFNGGGDSGVDLGNDKDDGGGGGGGSTDIRYNGDAIEDRIIVAAGGSGGAFDEDGAPGGDKNGRYMDSHKAYVDSSVSQTNGYDLLYGGPGIDFKYYPGSGGGGGYYGGWGGSSGQPVWTSDAIGRSGSSYISGTYGCETHKSQIYFTDGNMEVGEHSGIGSIKIEYIYECTDNCKYCSTSNTCTECITGYKLYENKCYSAYPTGTIKSQAESKFSYSNSFTHSKKFTESPEFSESYSFTKSSKFSDSSVFSKSLIFTESSNFSNSINFTDSNPFSSSSDFSKSNDFSVSVNHAILQNSKFYYSNSFTHSTEFTKSSDLKNFTKSSITPISFSESYNDLIENTTKSYFNDFSDFSKSRFSISSDEFSISNFLSSTSLTSSTSFAYFTHSLIFSDSIIFTPSDKSSTSKTFTPSEKFSEPYYFSSSDKFSSTFSYYKSRLHSLYYDQSERTFIFINSEYYYPSSALSAIQYISSTYTLTYLTITNKENRRKITKEQLIGIVCGVVSAFIIIALVLIFIYRRKQYSNFTPSPNNDFEKDNSDVNIDDTDISRIENQNDLSSDINDIDFWLGGV